jgi:lipoprotein-anchoring transpeptidase ErfK/SrfK
VAGVFVTRTTGDVAAPGRAAGSLPPTTVSASQTRAALAAGLTFAPAAGATAVPPTTPIVVKAAAGQLSDVRVTSSGGQIVRSSVSWSHDGWRLEGPLAYGTLYRVTATVAGPENVTAESTATFQTVAPTATVSAWVFPNSGLTLGVGQPIAFRFSRSITSPEARAAVLSHFSVTESRPVTGGWHWYSDSELHFRPEKFWPTGEHVRVAWDLTGWKAGVDLWGAGSGSSAFAIGHARVSIANLTTHLMTVTDNGRVVAVYPISGGKPTDPTMGGVHIVLDRQSVVRMNSATNGVPVNSPDGYDELVYKNVHISDTGEYVHAAPWSLASQGHANVSHGCINLSPTNATAYFAFSRVGDVVVVTGSPRPPVVGDHGVMDWDTPWSGFTPQPAPVYQASHTLRF